MLDPSGRSLPHVPARPAANPYAGPAPAPAPGVAERERSLAERWLEDESLRGDLDDQTWQPIQDWLLRVAARVARATAGQDDVAAQPLLDRAQGVGKSLARSLTDALGANRSPADLSARLEPLHHELRSPIVEDDRAPRVQAALRSAAAELSRARADGPTMAARLTAALDTELTSTSAGGQR